MSSQIQSDVNTERTQNRLGSANYLLYYVYGMVVLAAFSGFFQDASSQAKTLMISFPVIICMLGTYIQRLEIRITALESQLDHHEQIDSV